MRRNFFEHRGHFCFRISLISSHQHQSKGGTFFALFIYLFFFLFKLHKIILPFIFNSRTLFQAQMYFNCFYLFHYPSFISFSIFIPRYFGVSRSISVIFLFPFHPIFTSFHPFPTFFFFQNEFPSIVRYYFPFRFFFQFCIIFACLTLICSYVSSTITSRFSLFHLLFQILMPCRVINPHLRKR